MRERERDGATQDYVPFLQPCTDDYARRRAYLPAAAAAAAGPVIEYVFYFRHHRPTGRPTGSVRGRVVAGRPAGDRRAVGPSATGRYDRLVRPVKPVDYRPARPGLLDEGPDINWPAEIQFIRWRLAFQETRAPAAAGWLAGVWAERRTHTHTYGVLHMARD